MLISITIAKWKMSFEPGLSLPVDKLVKMYQETVWPSEHFVVSTEQIYKCTSYMQVHTIYEVHSLTVREHFQH